ncbi:MAG: hypothetical protein R3E32_13840 [Chitinophagales bacterium]
MKYLLKIITLFSCFQLITFSLQAQNVQSYSVQLGAFQKPNMDAFNSIKEIGPIHQEKTKSGLTRVLLGEYAQKKQAEVSLKAAQDKGFGTAFVIRRMIAEEPKPSTVDDTKPKKEEDIINVSENYKEDPPKKEVIDKPIGTTTTTEKPMPEDNSVLPDEVYVVQLAAFKSNVPKKEFETLSKDASVYKNSEGDWTRVVLGAKEKAEDAKALIDAAKKAGYAQAFVKKVASKKLELLFESKVVTPPTENNKSDIEEDDDGEILKADAENDTKDEEMIVDVVDNRDESGKPLPMSDKMGAAAIANIDLIDEINCIGCNEAEDKITIEGTIFPISDDNLLLEGRMAYVGDMYSQTLLLSSTDGGKNWKQVVAPDFGYEILHLDFVDEKVGYLINFWVVEGAGDLKLYKTTDAGKSWNFISAIPKNDFLCLPLITQFTDERNGLVIYECDVPDPGYYAWSTINGGQKWVSIGSITEEDYQAFLKNAADTKRKKELANDEFTNVVGNSSWRQETTDKFIIISKTNDKGEWKEVSRLKRNYKKINGEITAIDGQ